jgi:hypothetical protein
VNGQASRGSPRRCSSTTACGTATPTICRDRETLAALPRHRDDASMMLGPETPGGDRFVSAASLAQSTARSALTGCDCQQHAPSRHGVRHVMVRVTSVARSRSRARARLQPSGPRRRNRRSQSRSLRNGISAARSCVAPTGRCRCALAVAPVAAACRDASVLS